MQRAAISGILPGLRINIFELLEIWEEEGAGELRDDLWRPMRRRR